MLTACAEGATIRVADLSSMASLLAVLLVCATSMTSGCTDATAQRTPPAAGDAEASPFAVVELFTSEGCSSCPPADELLSALAAEARRDGQPVHFLAFHVDYWDRLGWTDPYADAAFTRRQRGYVERFASRGAYTPQMIVNGTTEFVGSNRATATRAIDEALKRQSVASVKLTGLSRTADTATVNYLVTPLPVKALLHIALVERELVTKVRNGENAGRSLRHDNVVRHFQTIALADGEGTALVKLSPSLRPEHSSVIAYVQHAEDRSVLGATSVDLNGAATRPTSAVR